MSAKINEAWLTLERQDGYKLETQRSWVVVNVLKLNFIIDDNKFMRLGNIWAGSLYIATVYEIKMHVLHFSQR